MIPIDYEVELAYQPSLGDSRLRKPIVAVRISAGASYEDTLALVDSGADYSIFHAELCEALGLTLTDGQRKPLVGLDGKRYCGYIHRVAITLLSAPQSWPPVRGEIIFRENHPKDVGNLLGRRDFFRALRVGFHERRGRLYLGQA